MSEFILQVTQLTAVHTYVYEEAEQAIKIETDCIYGWICTYIYLHECRPCIDHEAITSGRRFEIGQIQGQLFFYFFFKNLAACLYR